MGRVLYSFCSGLFLSSIMNLEYATAATLVFATPISTALSVPLLGNKVGHGGGLQFYLDFWE